MSDLSNERLKEPIERSQIALDQIEAMKYCSTDRMIEKLKATISEAERELEKRQYRGISFEGVEA